MTSVNYLLNKEDLLDNIQPSSSQSLSLTPLSSHNEETPPGLLDSTWTSLSTEDTSTVTVYDLPFDYHAHDYFELPDDGFQQWQHDGELRGLDKNVLDDTSFSNGEYEFDDSTSHPIDELSSLTEERLTNTCYGMIYRAAAQLTGDMSHLRQKLNSSRVPKISGHAVLRVGLAADGIWLLFSDGTKFAQLNAHLSKILPTTLQFRHVEMEALVNLITFQQTVERATKSDEASIRVNINVYGMRIAKQEVGKELSRGKMFLQQPDYPRQGTIYENPHFLQLDGFGDEGSVIDAVNTEEDGIEAPREEDFGTSVNNIYLSLKRGTHLQRLEADASLQTPLLPHQQEALDFMTQRETGPITDEFRLWRREDSELQGEVFYRHVITKDLLHDQPSETGGGVLADVMGLGKTLSTLSLLAKTRSAAHEWACGTGSLNTAETGTTQRRSRATIVLVSSYLLLNHWLSEVDRHLNGSFKVVKHHGPRRERIAAIIANSDIVLTTYHTLAAEMADRASPLHEISWYRIVLDEAHIIRHRQTTFYQSCLKVSAANRWCLTGTPIQNTLDDIGALFSFIKVQPFDSIGTFRSYITTPFDESRERQTHAAERLRKLLDSLCLRRTRDIVELPEQREVLRELDLSPAEREQYQQTKNMMNRAIRQRFGEIDRKNVFGLFQAQLQLRLSCNHGTFQNPFLWTNHRHMITERENAVDFYGQLGEVSCAVCHQPLPLTSVNSTYSNEYSCRHICCLDCLEQSADGQDLDPDLRMSRCPVCESRNMKDRKRNRQQQGSGSNLKDGYFRESGYSTKMEALVVDVQRDLWSSKSVIFSCWTRTLDLVERHFQRNGISLKRIDGTSPLHARQATLDDFSCNPHTPILLMTTGTGAFGLNIPVANRIFIIESQWNPHTERQAIARAMRLGQKHPIVVYRYVVNGSVEQEMRSQQLRKLNIAEVGW